jgi:hypothetical protein
LVVLVEAAPLASQQVMALKAPDLAVVAVVITLAIWVETVVQV